MGDEITTAVVAAVIEASNILAEGEGLSGRETRSKFHGKQIN